jgi:hypothetical protein
MPLSDSNAEVTHIFGVLRFEYSSSPGAKAWTESEALDPSAAYIEPIDVPPPVNTAAD